MIKFIQEKETSKELTLADVEDNQFFINGGGSFCQKTHFDLYHIIATHNGTPFSVMCDNRRGGEIIQKILPLVTKIEFNN